MDMRTDTLVWDRWLAHAGAQPNAAAIIHCVAGEEPWTWTWEGVIERARRYAGMLLEKGVRPGQVCATILRHHREFYPLYMAIEAVGALPAVLAYPNNRLHPDKFRQGLSGMAARSGLDWILTHRDLEETIRPLLSQGRGIHSLLFPLEWDPGPAEIPHPTVRPDQPCLLQHSSGTTGLQKPVMLSHQAILEHVRRYGRAIGLSAADRVCSWLPLYHDMGLIAAFHMPLAAGITSIQIDPFEWVSRAGAALGGHFAAWGYAFVAAQFCIQPHGRSEFMMRIWRGCRSIPCGR